MEQPTGVFEGSFLQQFHPSVLARQCDLQASSYRLALLDEANDREPFLNYLLFTHWPDLVSPDQPISAASIYYNRLHWFTVLAAHHPEDAGIQQQHFQLLADHTPVAVDWDVVQQILALDGLA